MVSFFERKDVFACTFYHNQKDVPDWNLVVKEEVSKGFKKVKVEIGNSQRISH